VFVDGALVYSKAREIVDEKRVVQTVRAWVSAATE
jgi:hypothetical protein